MAEGGDHCGLKDTDLDDLLDEKDDSDDEKEVNRTRPFQPDEPGAASIAERQQKCKLCSTSSPACLTLLMKKPLCSVISWILKTKRACLKMLKKKSEIDSRM